LRQDASTPIPPGWKVVRTETFGELVEKAEAHIQLLASRKKEAARR
jgi:hypothetical protein